MVINKKANPMIKNNPKIPVGWGVKRLDEVGIFISGTGFPEKEQGGIEGIPFYKVSDMNLSENSIYMIKSNNYVTEDQIRQMRIKPILKKSILFAKVGAAIFLERKRIAKNFLCDNNMMCFSPFDFSLFYKYYFDILRLSKYAQVGALPSYNASDLANIKILLPPLPEQEKIAEILGTWDSAIEKLTALIAAKRLQKKGLMQKLLTAQIRLPGFTGEWQKQKLGCLFSFHRSLSASRAQLGEIGIPYLHYGDIHKTGKTSFNPEKDELPKLDYRENAEKYLLKNGDVVFVDASEDRKDASRFCVIKNKNNVPFLAGLHTVVVRPKSDELNVNFSEFLFQSNDFRKQVSILANGMKIFGVSKDILSNIVIRYPQNIVEQKAIADVLSKADEEIDLLTRKLDLLQSQKKGLMQQLLTGKIRVKVA